MRLRVRHQTDYRYSLPVSQSVNQLCLTPRSTERQQCLTSELILDPAPDHVREQTDNFGNTIQKYTHDAPHSSSSITITSTIETEDQPAEQPLPLSVTALQKELGVPASEDALLAQDCLLPSTYVTFSDVLDELMQRLQPRDQPVFDVAESLMTIIYSEFQYDPSFSTIVTPIEKVVTARKGVCQDFAHLGIAVLRRLGIPARYVSGYMETQPPPGQTKLRGADASHAWYSVYQPNAGWMDFDPTNNQRPDGRYVTTAWGRDYADVTPVRGVVFGGGTHKMSVAVDVDRLD